MANHTAPEPTPPETEAAPGLAECLTPIECWVEENAFLARLAATLLVLIAAWLAMRLAERAFTRSARRLARMRRFDEYRTKALVGRTRPMRLGVNIVVFVTALLALLMVWSLDAAFTGVLAGAGFAGIVVGLAAAESLGNVVAGFLIFYNHPFEIGDWVDIDGVEGIIEDVALVATTILTWDNEKVTLSNRAVQNSKIKNFTAARRLRRRLVVGVEYGSHLGLAMQTLVELAKAHPEVLPEPEPSAVANGFGSSSVDLVLRFYVEPVRSSAVKVYTDLVHQVHDTFRQKGITIAFPHMQVVQARPWQVAEADGRPEDGRPGDRP